MFIGLRITKSVSDINNHRNCIHTYQLNDTKFIKYFDNSSIMHNNETYNDVDHINCVLENVFYIYKYSDQPICINFNRLIQFTYSSENSIRLIKKTSFYKTNKNLIDNILKKEEEKC